MINWCKVEVAIVFDTSHNMSVKHVGTLHLSVTQCCGRQQRNMPTRFGINRCFLSFMMSAVVTQFVHHGVVKLACL